MRWRDPVPERPRGAETPRQRQVRGKSTWFLKPPHCSSPAPHPPIWHLVLLSYKSDENYTTRRMDQWTWDISEEKVVSVTK